MSNESKKEEDRENDKDSEDFGKNLNQKWNDLTFGERKFYQDMVRAIASQKEDEDNSSICSEENEGTYILDSEDEAFKVKYPKEIYSRFGTYVILFNYSSFIQD